MVATLAKAATADYYIHSQASFRPPGEYYFSGEEPDGVWWNPSGLFVEDGDGPRHGETLDSADFYRLYRGLDPRTGEKLTQNADSDKRCPAYDLVFNADKTVSALWAIAPAELRSEIEKAHNDAVRVALEDTVRANCSFTRIREDRRGMKVVPADIMAALFQHGASRSNDPHLHTHCVILNLARAHHDGKWRALHGNPLYSWQKAAGATYRAELAWLLRERLGIEMEIHGEEQQYTRIAGISEGLVGEWSKRDVEITDTAARFGVKLQGNAGLHSAIQKMTRVAKEHGLDPETRHLNWIEEAARHVAHIPEYVESLTGGELEFTEEQRRGVAGRLAAIPSDLTRFRSVFKYTDLVERSANAAGGLLARGERKTMLAELMKSRGIVELDKPDTSYDAGARLAHGRTFTAAHTIETERSIHELATRLSTSRQFGIAERTAAAKIDRLAAADYPISEEQVTAIRAATRPGQLTIIEGAAGSGKTTTLRPIADLYREQGHDVIATSVSWRVTLELGSDLEAPNWCVDKLAVGIANGTIDVRPRSVIVVDEAGQLSSMQALKILQIADTTGAKIIFAGDTQQQQPVEAGPGLRLIRDVVGTTRVDTIRRQRHDTEDMLVALDGLGRQEARGRAVAMSRDEAARAAERFHALPEEERTARKPWQVVASEQFRDGEAAQAIAAYHRRGRIHIDSRLDRTLDRLIGDWDRVRTGEPGTSTAVIAYSKAEVRALSHLMRERVLEGYDGPRHTVMACRGREPRARPEPLEIAVGDTIRTGAAHFGKRLFNGTRVDVLDLREDPPSVANPGVPRLWIRGRTDRGRIVEFFHDQITDYHGKIRLDHGYAMTMNAAQGLTVDRAFVLANHKPSRETIYPAATRHRDRMDIYVDRAPVELDIRNRRSEDVADDPVTDRDVLAFLAGSWARSRPEEAAQDYMTEHMRARRILGEPPGDRRPAAVEQDVAAAPRVPGQPTPAPRPIRDPDGLDAPAWLAGNDSGDGLLSELAARIRYSEIEVRHGLAARTIGDACRKLNASLAAWDAARKTDGNAAVATHPRFRDDLKQAAAILRTVRPFLKNDPLHARVLREHGGIEISDLQTLAAARRRAVSIRRMSLPERHAREPRFAPSVRQKTREDAAVHAIGAAFGALQPAEPGLHAQAFEPVLPPAPELDQGQPYEPGFDHPTADPEPRAPGIEAEPPADFWEGWDQRAVEPDIDPRNYDPDDLSPDEDRAYGEQTRDAGAYSGTDEPDLPPAHQLSPSDAVPPGTLAERWTALCADAAERGLHPFAAPGWTDIRRDMRELAASPDTPEGTRARLVNIVRIADNWLHKRAADIDPSAPISGPAPNAQPAPPGPSALVGLQDRRLIEHCRAAAREGVHPFDVPGWDRLEEELHETLDLPGLAPADRRHLETHIANIEAERRHLATPAARADAVRPARHDSAAEQLYRDLAARHGAYIDNFFDPGRPARMDFEGWDRLAEEADRLLHMPGLSAAARADLVATYRPFDYLDIAKRVPAPDAAEPAAGKGRGDAYAAFNRLFADHAASAERKGLHPYAAPGWKELADKARTFLADAPLTTQQRDNLRKLLDYAEVWNAPRPEASRTRSKDSSRGMSF